MAIDYVALKNECQNNPNGYSATIGGVSRTLAQWFASGDFSICAAILNVVDPAFFVYRTAIPVAEVFDAIVWANFTPADNVPLNSDAPGLSAFNAAVYQARQLACQTKQMSVQTILLGGQGVLNGAKPLVRAGLQDALTALPSGAGGASRAAGWVTIRDSVLARAATRAEKLLANKGAGDGATTATAATLTFEGNLTDADIQTAKAA